MAKLLAMNLTNLEHLDFGKINAVFEHELKHIVGDIRDRPSDDGTRKVVLTVNCKPSDDTGEHVSVEIEVKSSVPVRRTRVIDMRVHQDGRLSFVPDLFHDQEQEKE